MVDNRTEYETRIQDRPYWRYLLGLLYRWKLNIRYERARRIARNNGAIVGECVIMPISLAKKLNSNCRIGSHVSIQTDKIDTRSSLTIGNYVIIGGGTEIITTSHDIDSPEWKHKHYGLTVEDYCWLPTNVLVLPSCRRIGYGAVVGSGSVVVKDVEPMSVVSGNPAIEIKKRKCVHSSLVVESLLCGDIKTYGQTWKSKSHQ